MGQWQIRGADRASGRDVGQIYDAHSRDEAAAKAADDGMLVETIEELLTDEGANALENMDALERALRAEAAEAAEASGTATTLDYGNARQQQRRGEGPAPTYPGLLIAGRIIRVFAFIYYTIGAVMFVLGLWSLLQNPSAIRLGPLGLGEFGLVLIGWPLGIAMIGALLHGVGSACFALRDIARNSWR